MGLLGFQATRKEQKISMKRGRGTMVYQWHIYLDLCLFGQLAL